MFRLSVCCSAAMLAVTTSLLTACQPTHSNVTVVDKASNSTLDTDELVHFSATNASLKYTIGPVTPDQLLDGSQLSKLNFAHQPSHTHKSPQVSNKQTQDFDVGKVPLPSAEAALSTTTAKPASVVTSGSVPSNDTSAITTTTTSNPVTTVTEDPFVLPPVASKTVREGNAVQCGEANASGQSERKLLTDRIVGGRKSEPGEFPYQVRLSIRSKRGSGICGGIILDEYHILTAAHCMTACVSRKLTTTTLTSQEVAATIGDHAIRSADGEIEVPIERVTPHEKYDACNFYANDHDIALLKTGTKINFRFTADGYGSINRPCLPPKTSIEYKPIANQSTPLDQVMPVPRKEAVYRDGESVIVSGWGVMRENSGALSNILRYVKIPMVNTTSCQEVYGSRVTDKHVCAGFQAGGKDSCQGDSGGPLVRIVDNKYELVGIVSFGYGCAQPGAFGVYTRIASYIDWINSNL